MFDALQSQKYDRGIYDNTDENLLSNVLNGITEYS